MAKTATELKEIARAGGGMNLDAHQYSATELKEIGRASASNKGQISQIIIRNADSMTATELKEIARTSPGGFVFEI